MGWNATADFFRRDGLAMSYSPPGDQSNPNSKPEARALNAKSDFFLEFDGLSMKSVWPRRAAEQTLRRRPSKHQRQTEQRWLVSGWRLVEEEI